MMLDENGRPILFCEKCGKYPSTANIQHLYLDAENCIPYCPDCDGPLTEVIRMKETSNSGDNGAPVMTKNGKLIGMKIASNVVSPIPPDVGVGEPLIKATEKTTEGTLGIAVIDKKTGKKVYLTSGQIAREHREL